MVNTVWQTYYKLIDRAVKANFSRKIDDSVDKGLAGLGLDEGLGEV